MERWLTDAEMHRLVHAALVEDVGSGDATTLATVPAEAQVKARVVAREPVVVAGLALAEAVFREVAPGVRVERLTRDGERVAAGGVLAWVAGAARGILTAERVALNFLQRLSGIATLTAAYVAAVAGTQARILDTRKTTPGWRFLEKYGVVCGGGTNHRAGLFDLVLIKDNHLAALAGAKPNPIAAAVRRAREHYPALRVEVEADRLEQVDQALVAGADIILLDNMSLADLRSAVARSAVARSAGRVRLEASGGVTLATVRAIAETGVDDISVGALTHSARAVDLALDMEMEVEQKGGRLNEH